MWYRGYKKLPQKLKDRALEPHSFETYVAAAGVVWYRERSAIEQAELIRIDTEHHPTFDGEVKSP